MEPEGLPTWPKKFGLIPYPEPVQSSVHIDTFFLNTSILSSHLRLDLSSGLLPALLSIQILYMSRLYVLLNYMPVISRSRILIADGKETDSELISSKNFPNLVANDILMCQCHSQILYNVSTDEPGALRCYSIHR
jgi:hypothetical protein